MLKVEIIPDETNTLSSFLFPVWSSSMRKPLFWTESYLNEVELPNVDWGGNLTLTTMATSSAANGVYFNTYQKEFTYTDNNTAQSIDFTTGGSIASNPALYAYIAITQTQDIDSAKVSVTQIGSKAGSTSKINSQVNLLQWASRLVSLASPVK